MDLTEAEDIKKRWQEYTEELYKKDLHDSDNYDGVIVHLEPDIMEGKVKWALGSITTKKASGCDGIPMELFQILKDDAGVQYASKFGKFSSGHRTGKVHFSFQSQRKSMPNNTLPSSGSSPTSHKHLSPRACLHVSVISTHVPQQTSFSHRLPLPCLPFLPPPSHFSISCPPERLNTMECGAALSFNPLPSAAPPAAGPSHSLWCLHVQPRMDDLVGLFREHHIPRRRPGELTASSCGLVPISQYLEMCWLV